MPQPYEAQIDEIMDRFRFKTVKQVMDLLNWCWDGNNAPPSLEELRVHGLRMLTQATGIPDGQAVERVGFRVEKRAGVLEMMFVVHSWGGD